MATSQGYKCEFIDSVFDDLYCKKCTLVARRLTVTICCGESFCKVCIADLKEQGKPCPECGEKDFTTFEHVKNMKRINCLQAGADPGFWDGGFFIVLHNLNLTTPI